jgi:hypothetical protein
MRGEYVYPGDTDALGFVFEGFAAGLERCAPEEIGSIVKRLSERTREQLACYCLGNERFKEVGREIATVCFETHNSHEPAEEMKAWSEADFHHDERSKAA